MERRPDQETMEALQPTEILTAGPIAALIAWATAGWSLTPAQAHRLVELTPTAGPEVLSLNTSAIYLGIAAGATLGGRVLHLGAPQLALTAAGLQLVALIVVIRVPARPADGRTAESAVQHESPLVSTL